MVLLYGIDMMAQNKQEVIMEKEQLTMTQEWDKTFLQSNFCKQIRYYASGRYVYTQRCRR